MSSPKPLGDILQETQSETDERFITLSQGKWMFRTLEKHHERDGIHPDLRAVISEVCLAARPWPLLLYGEAGSGKTCAAMCMVDVYGGWFAGLGDMVDDYWLAQRGQLQTSSGYAWTFSEFRAMWTRANLAVLDEIGERREVSEAHYETTKKLVDWREKRGLRPTVYISNRKPDEIGRIYGDPLASRLTGGTVVRVDGDRRRQNKTTVKVQA
jgi:hypothetical protein